MGLKETLAGALFVSETTGREREIRLARGLVVAVRAGRKTTRLRLKRPGVYPSATEWQTVIDHLPYPVGEVVPEPGMDGLLYMLTGSWPTPARLIADGAN